MSQISKKGLFDLLGYEPHEAQEQLHAACEEPSVKYVVVMCGTRWGKTKAAAHEMFYQAMLPRKEFMGWCVAPTHTTAKAIFDMLVTIARQVHGDQMRYDKNEGVMEFTNFGGGKSQIMRRTTHGPKGTGRLSSFAVDFMVVDEAANRAIPDGMWEAELRTRLMDRRGKAILISTPRGTQGFFIALHRQASQDSNILALTFPTWSNTKMFPLGLKDPEIQDALRTMPYMRFLQEICAQPMAEEGVFFPHQHIEDCSVLQGWEDPIPAGEYAAGLDLGIKRDATVLTVVRAALPFDNAKKTPKVVLVHRMLRLPVEEQLRQVREIQDRYGIQVVYCDEGGMGVPILQQAINAGIYARGVTWSNKTKMDDLYNLKVLLERRGIRLPDGMTCPSLQNELKIFEWQCRGKVMSAGAPEGSHDDHVASLAFACKFFPAAGTDPGGQVFHANQKSAHRPDPQQSQGSGVTVRRIGPYQEEAGNVFTTNNRSRARGLWDGNSVVDF